MKPYDKILVPVDFSACTTAAIHVAADLSRHYEAAVTLAHVFDAAVLMVPDGMTFYVPGQLENLRAEYAKLLAKAKQEAEHAGALGVETCVLDGTVSDSLIEFARSGGFDLVVIGTHGRKGLQHALIGSVAERVVRGAPCPVLTVKASKAA